ncbi:MAG TPA: ABC transporter permease [Pseudobdellovibrionaceae bacterium]|nr:ABC transporter permease [Pseudobdellovibrionaceae bacterium]
MIEVSRLTKEYHMGGNVVRALKSVSLSIEEGDFVAIMGPSGSGKSTLMQILGLLDVPTDGSYRLFDREVSGLSEDELAILRRDKIGFIFQQFNLLPRMSAVENVALPLLYSKKERGLEGSMKLLEQVGLGTRAAHQPNELSGGQQQRVAIARSLVNRPRLVFADEPTGNLDSKSEIEIMETLRRLNEQGITVIIVTHAEEIGQQAKRLIRMRDGEIQSDVRNAPLPKVVKTAAEERTPENHEGIDWQEYSEFFKQGMKTLWASKVRTFLSMLGILIGVAAVVTMLALGTGAQKAVEEQLTSLGSNLLVLRPGAYRIGGIMQESSVTRLTPEDATAIRGLPNVSAVVTVVNGKAQATYQNKNWNTQIQGTTPSYPAMHAAEPVIGRFFTEDEEQKRARVAVIGVTVARELFGDASPLGEMIKLNKVIFQVIGVLPEKGASGFRDQDDIIIIPTSTAMRRLFGKTYVDNIEIQAVSAGATALVDNTTLELMRERKRIPPSRQADAFTIRNMADIQAALSATSRTMSMLLASIAAISLVVGGIGIMNIMLVSVTERTKEIGLRKAIGAKRSDILLQFLVESVAISAFGGLIGVVLGCLASVFLSQVAGWAISISIESILLSFFFSAAIGIAFGIYPARKASLRHPIEALRYE